MASFSILSYDSSSVSLQIVPSGGYRYYRVYVRTETNVVYYDEWHYGSVGFYVDVTGLAPGTEYVVNVAYNSTPDASGSTWIGAQYFTTEGSSGGGSVETVPVFIDFSTEEIYRMRFRYYDETGEEVSSDYIYGPEFLYVAANSWLYVRNLTLADGALPPVHCTLPDGSQQMVVDENDDWADRDLYVDGWGGTYWFQTGSGGGGGDYGSFIERTVHINGQRYIPYISDGYRWYEYKALIAE